MAEADEMAAQHRSRSATADEIFAELEKTGKGKRQHRYARSTPSKSFAKDLERLSRSGRYDMHRLKDAMLLLSPMMSRCDRNGSTIR